MPTPDLLIAGEDPNTATGGQFARGYLALPGRSGYNASTPDAAKYTPAVSLDVRYQGTLPPTLADALVSQRTSSGNFGWMLNARSSGGALNLLASSDGATDNVNFTSSAHGVAPSADYEYRVLALLSGTVTFYKRDPALGLSQGDDANWTQVSTHSPGAFTIFDSAAAVYVGASIAGAANVSRMGARKVLVKVDGVTVCSPDFTAQPAGTATFNDAQGNTWTVAGPLAADSSGNGRDAALLNGVTLGNAGKWGNCLTFDGTNDRAQVNAWTYGSSFTWAAWVKPASVGGATAQTICSNTAGTNGALLRVNATTGLFGVQGYNGASAQTALASTTAASTSAWKHVAFTYDGTNGRLYVDGVLEAGPTAMTITASTLDFLIGADNPTTPARFFGGGIDDVRSYAAALSAAEVAAVMTPSSSSPAPYFSGFGSGFGF